MDKHNLNEDETDSVRVIYFVHHNKLSLGFREPKTFIEAWNGTAWKKWKLALKS
jgi:hypothetical protein